MELCPLAETRNFAIYSLESGLFSIFLNHSLFLWNEVEAPHQEHLGVTLLQYSPSLEMCM